ncbi:MAG TPA: hemin uptake protein HemP [Burkholderiaceae bacterium]|nr:hemin uptake protein HemP [Burkholderiaceae bacterium]
MTTAVPAEPPRSNHVSEPERRDIARDAASTVLSESLLRGQKSVAIHHNGLVYRLQATRLGKLILTK